MKEKKTLNEAREELNTAFFDTLYEFVKDIGLLWLAKHLVKHVPFLDLQEWIKEREKRKDTR